jgi:hypothetical protein
MTTGLLADGVRTVEETLKKVFGDLRYDQGRQRPNKNGLTIPDCSGEKMTSMVVAIFIIPFAATLLWLLSIRPYCRRNGKGYTSGANIGVTFWIDW